MSSHARWLVFIVLLMVFSVWVVLPDTRIADVPDYCEAEVQHIGEEGIYLDTNADCELDFTLPVRQSLGLDIVGGLRVLLEAELPPTEYTPDDLRETANNVSRRVNALGIGEATIQVQGNRRILVELPGVNDREQAINTVQQTALLEFVDFRGLGNQTGQLVGRKILTTEQVLIQEQRSTAESEIPSVEATAEAEDNTTPAVSADAETPDEPSLLNPLTGQPFQTVMTGNGLKAASAQPPRNPSFDPTWTIGFELKPEATDLFSAFTAEAARTREPMAIVLDGEVLSAPRVNDALTTGGIISGNFTEESAQQLALQLRSGALPIPLRVESAQEVGATLGQESVGKSVRAGIVGVIIVFAFMIIYYRVPGISAALALLVFIILNLAVFKLIPVTLTLPAITGFLISIGTAVDGNILIFERIKEELRDGNSLDDSLEAGFDRAWNSIRDSNTSTIIICFILFMFGQTPGASIVSGFAITLGLGLVLNLFTAVLVTRTFLHTLVAMLRTPLTERKWLLGV
jgi:protein-export membrane protein SecD